MVRDAGEGQEIHVEKTEEGKEQEGERAETKSGVVSPGAPVVPADGQENAPKQERQPGERRATVNLPARIDHAEVHGEQGFAEIKPDRKARSGQASTPIFGLDR